MRRKGSGPAEHALAACRSLVQASLKMKNMIHDSTPSAQPNVLRLLASLAIDYFRWSQLAPMILMWAFTLGMLLVMIIVSYEELTLSLFEGLTRWIANLPWVGPRFVDWMQAQSTEGAPDPGDGQLGLEAIVLRGWAVVSAVFMAFAWLASRLFGPFQPWTLQRKLKWAAWACLGFVAAVMALFALDREHWNDPASKVLFSSGGLALVLFIVSSWCLSVSHFLGHLSKMVLTMEFKSSKPIDRYYQKPPVGRRE